MCMTEIEGQGNEIQQKARDYESQQTDGHKDGGRALDLVNGNLVGHSICAAGLPVEIFSKLSKFFEQFFLA